MKIIADPIEMVAKFDVAGNLAPARFKHGELVVNVEQVLSAKEERFAGNIMKVFVSQSEIDGEIKQFELKFELQDV